MRVLVLMGSPIGLPVDSSRCAPEVEPHTIIIERVLRPIGDTEHYAELGDQMLVVAFYILTASLGAILSGCSATINPAIIADAQTAVRAKTALVNDPQVGEFTIEVQVVAGVATVSGRVRSRADMERAIGLVESVEGVRGVKSELQIGSGPLTLPSTPTGDVAPSFRGLSEIDPSPGLLAVGGTVGWSIPGGEALKTRVSASPLVRIGSPSGVGFTIAFDWFHANLESADRSAMLARVHVKPVMAGVGYTIAATRFSVAPSLVAGYAFNSLSITGTGLAEGLPVEVENSFAWRIGASVWIDLNHRLALNVSTGYLMTGLRFTILERGRLDRFDASGDTTVLHLGVAYKWF